MENQHSAQIDQNNQSIKVEYSFEKSMINYSTDFFAIGMKSFETNCVKIANDFQMVKNS